MRALSFLTLLLVAGCGSGTPPAPAASPPAPVDYHQPGDPRQIGTGLLVETSLDGSAAYVEEEDPRFPEPGCEGLPEPVLFRQPLAGGERELLSRAPEQLNGEILRPRRGRRIAVVQGCEEFFSALLVGSETPEGRLEDVEEVSVQQTGNGSPPPNTFAWSVDGSYLLAAPELPVDGGGEPSLVRVDPSSGAVTRVFGVMGGDAISQVGQRADGSYLLAAGGRVTLRDRSGAVVNDLPGQGFEIAPDGRQFAVFGDALLLLPADGDEPKTLVPQEGTWQITSAAFSPDGRAIVYARTSDDDTSIGLVTAADARTTEVAGPGQLGRALFSGDGRALAFNEFGSAPQFVSKLMLVQFG